MSRKPKRSAAPPGNPSGVGANTSAPNGDAQFDGELSGPPTWSRFLPAGAARIVGGFPKIRNRRAILLWSAMTLGMLCVTVPGIAWWPVAYVCLVPWLICVCCAARAPFLYFGSYLLGLGYMFITVNWMYPVTLPGYIAMCGFFALQFPLMAWPIRHLYQKRGISVAIAAPIVWTAFEYLRCIGPLGFPMNLLGHSHYRVLTMIQISDLVGAYGVSFVLAMINGWITDLLIQPIQIHRAEKAARLPMGSLITAFVFIGTIIYGISQSSSRHLSDGPKIAMIQHDFPMYVDSAMAGRSPYTQDVCEAYFQLAQQALREKPDLVLLPETALNTYINDEFVNGSPDDMQEILKQFFPPGWSLSEMRDRQSYGRQLRERVQILADTSRAAIVVGATAAEWRPTALPPRAYRFNSAYLFAPDQSAPVARYDKNHIVLFGEYVPFRDSIPWLYAKLNAITPFGANGRHYSLCPGENRNVFEFSAATDPQTRFRAGVPICYEEIMPYINREFARGEDPANGEKNIGLLLPISNDGWFMHTAQLEQHLAAGVFRAVENRIAVARAVNTGASAMIHPNGKIHSRVVMPPEQIDRLKGVETVLNRAAQALQKLQSLPAASNEAQDATVALRKVVQADLEAAYTNVGPGFAVFGERMSRLCRNVVPTIPIFTETSQVLADQIRLDLEMINRWRERPGTAPGMAVDQAKLDPRLTLYTQWGDWFARLCLGLVLLCLIDWFQLRVRRNRAQSQAMEGEAP